MSLVRLFQLTLKWSFTVLIIFSSLSSAGITGYNFVAYGAGNYEHYPKSSFWKIMWCVGLPGSIIIFLVGMTAFIALMITIGNWIIYGKFKYSVND